MAQDIPLNKNQIFQFPPMTRGVWRVWRRHWKKFSETFFSSISSLIFEPLFYLFVFSFGLGDLIDRIDGQTYSTFIFPSVLICAAALSSFNELSFASWSRKESGSFEAVALTPISWSELAFGEILWGITKGLMSAAGVSLVAYSGGFFDSNSIFLVFAFVFLTSWIFSSLGLLMMSLVPSSDYLAMFKNFFVLPVIFLSGTFFPIDKLHPVLEKIVFLLPVSHAVKASRLVFDGSDFYNFALNTVVLIFFAVILTNLAIRNFEKKMTIEI